MFDLEQAIADWRERMLAGGIKSPVPLDELESHLREEMDAQTTGGASVQDAFASGVDRLGGSERLREEFGKLPGAGRERTRAALLSFAGVSNPQSETDMSPVTANTSIEPTWVTYARAAVFIAPAIFLWTFAVIFLIPKLQRICQEAGLAMPPVYRATNLIADHVLLTCGVPVVLLILLERRWSRWPQYRRSSLGGAVFLVNTAVLALITWMVVLALLAAPNLMQHAK